MLKYCGIVLVSGAISMYGAYLAGRLGKNRALREALYELLIHIKAGIDYGAAPLSDIFASFQNELLESVGFTPILKDGSHDAFRKAIESEVIKLPNEISKLYESLAASLGKSGLSKVESELVARYMSLISTEEDKLSKKEQVKQVLYRRLGLLCGLFAALLLI